MKQPMSDNQKAEIRVECLKLALRKDEQQSSMANANDVVRDAENFSQFALKES